MKAAVHSKYGPPEQVVSVREIETPTPKEREVLVRVRAASMHPDVWQSVMGLPYFFRLFGAGVRGPKRTIPGTDLAGEVTRIGKDVTRFRVGDEVFGETSPSMFSYRGGAFAEYVAVHESLLALKPSNVTFEQAAAVAMSGYVALWSIRAGGTLTGKNVLVNGAGGCVGSIAVQIAKAEGARVTGVDREEKLALIRALGADAVVDFTKEDFTQGSERFDFIYDVPATLFIPVNRLRECKRVLAPNGIYWFVGHGHYGEVGGSLFGTMNPRYLGRFLSMSFDEVFPKSGPKFPKKQATLQKLKSLLETGKLTPIIAKTFPLSEVPAAIECLRENRTPGRIVVKP